MTGKIQGINYMQGSGIATVILLDETDEICLVHADAGPLFRSIAASGLRKGDEIDFTLSNFGTMVGFTVVGDGA